MLNKSYYLQSLGLQDYRLQNIQNKTQQIIASKKVLAHNLQQHNIDIRDAYYFYTNTNTNNNNLNYAYIESALFNDVNIECLIVLDNNVYNAGSGSINAKLNIHIDINCFDLLSKMLHSIALKNVYMLNINADSDNNNHINNNNINIKNYADYIHQYINQYAQILTPKAILILGCDTLKMYLETLENNIYNIPIVYTYALDYILQHTECKKDVWKHLNTLKHYL